MNKKIDSAYLNQYTDNAIKRGFEIHDGWINKKLDSRKIVASAHSAVKLFNKRKTMAAFIEALAYLFALDAHIKEKYNNILRCLFAFFSWRRETRALNSLKNELNIPLGETDIRNLIAVEIERLAEKLENEWEEDGDDETHGGKRNGKAEEDVASEEKDAEVTEENPESEEIVDKEENKKDTEKKEETPIEEAPQEEAKEEIGEKKETAEPQQNETKNIEVKEEELAQSNDEAEIDENNLFDEKSEQKSDINQELETYIDAVDPIPIYEKNARDTSAEKTSFIDEMILDDMVKGDKNIIGYRRIDEAERYKEASQLQNTVTNQKSEAKDNNRDAYLYDKINATNIEETHRSGKIEATTQPNQKAEEIKPSAQQTGNVTEIKNEQPKEPIPATENENPVKQEFKPLGEMLQTDNRNVELENKLANDLNANMSLESKMAYIRMQEDKFREHMKITLEELGMNDTVDVLRVSEPDSVSSPSVTQNRK